MTKLRNSAARWDKLKSWHSLTEEVHKRLENSEKSDEGLTLDVGPQLLHTLRHPSELRSMVHTGTKLCNIFTAQYNKGAVQGVRAWILETNDMGVCKYLGFETECEITAITYVLKHRAYLTFSSDLVLRVFTDFNRNFVEVDSIPSLQTTLCLVYNKEEDEVYAGGIGFVEEWKIHGAEHAAKIVPGRKFYAELTRNDWIRDIQLVRENNQIVLQHGNGLSVLQLKTRKALHRLPNRHGGPLKCFCYYPQNDFLITGGADGKIKVFNGSVFNLMNSFIAHYGPVTGLECHKQDTLLFSCSHDGTLRIWRMDSFQLFMRLDIGERIQQMSLMGDSQFFFLQTDKDILVYTLNQFYNFFAAVESETKRLMCCRGKGNKTRILGSTEDGSVRLFSPVTGLTLTIIYPMPFFQVLMSFAYDLYQDKLHTVLTGGKVLTFNTGTNPCKAEEILLPSSEDEHVNVLLLVTVEFPCEDGTDIDNLVFAGLTNGQIVLIEALVCSLPEPLQAHEGSVTCMEACLRLNEAGTGIAETTRMIISGGTDMFVKIWSVDVEMEEKRPVLYFFPVIKIYLTSCPLLICMYSNLISVALCDKTSLGLRWCLLMYKLVPIKETLKHFLKNVCAKGINAKIDPVMPLQISHPPDEDHTQELLSLDMCPMLNLILTSGLDGYVKVWNHHNELLREMNFATPIYAACFANNKGDILVGYGTNVCSVAATTYLPLKELQTLLGLNAHTLYSKNIREVPVRFDHKSEPWLDLDKIKKFPIDIVARQQQRLTEDIINRLKKGIKHDRAPAKFVIFVDAGVTKVIRKDFADRLLNWAKGKSKLRAREKRHRSWDINALTEGSSDDEDTPPLWTPAKRNELSSEDKITAVTKSEEESRRGSLEPQFLDSENLLQIYPSSVGAALRALESRGQKGPVEMKLLNEKELLKRDPIIAPDGYIPNSVIRSRLKPTKVDTSILRRLSDKPFQLKPVPKANPHHLPSWWGLLEDKDEGSAVRYRVMKWDDSPSPTPRSLGPSRGSPVSPAQKSGISPFSPPIVEVESPVKKYIIAKSKSTNSLLKGKANQSMAKNRSDVMAKNKSDVSAEDNVPKMVKANKMGKNMKSGWEDSTVSGTRRTPGLSARSQRHSSAESEAKTTQENRLKPTTSTSGYKSKVISPSALILTPNIQKFKEVKSKRYEFNRYDLEMNTPGGRKSRVRRGEKLTSFVVDEDTILRTPISESYMNNDIIKLLMSESWMPEMDPNCDYNDFMGKLISGLDNDNPIVYDRVCNYITNIFDSLGLPEEILDMTHGKLGRNMNHINSSIKQTSIKTAQMLGQGRNDVIIYILPKLTDPEDPIRKAAADAITLLTGAQDKDQLLNILEQMGITSGVYNSKEDEEYALSVLAERFGDQGEDPQYFDRIQDWVKGTTPGIFEDEQGEDGIWQDGSKLSLQSKEKSFLSEGGKSVIDRYDTSGQNTMYAEMPATPGYSSENSELGFSRGVSMITIKSAGQKSNNSRYNARMELLDRGGASVMPTDRYEMPTPLSDIDNDAFMLDGYTLKEVDEDNEDGSPFMKDPLALFDDDDYDDDEDVGGLERGLSNLSGRDVLKSRENLISRDTARTRDSFEGMRLKERTATELSQVGPLPKFLARDNTARNFDDVSTDSAIESAISISEYATSHFSEKMTLSHLEQQSSQQSQVSEENNMFDVDQVSNLEYEGDFYDTDTNKNFEEIYRMKHELDIAHLHMHGLDYQANQNNLNNSGILNSVRPTVLENNYVLGLDTITSMAEERSESTDDDEEVEPESGKISVIVTPRGGLSFATPRDSNLATPRGSNLATPSGSNLATPRGSNMAPSRGSNLATPVAAFLGTPRALPGISEFTGKKDAKTPRSKRGDTGSTLRKRLQDMDGFSTISDRSSSSRRSGRFTPKDPLMYHYYDNRQAAQGAQYSKPRQGYTFAICKKTPISLMFIPLFVIIEEEEIEQRDSDFHTLSNVTSSRITDRLSGYDSGISKDMSEFSQGRAVRQGMIAPLSPVKSESGSPRPMSRPRTPQDWRKFFEMVPYAAERRQMEQIRREMIQGKLKPSTLPPISYFAENLPMLPGEAGTRLLQTVRVGEKVAAPGDGRHRIESVPGKLAVHTQNEDAGLSNYGILQMQWTTGVPTLKDHTQPPQRIPKHRNQGMIHALHEQTRADRPSSNRGHVQPDSEQELHFPHLKGASPSLTNQIAGNQYEWEFPLPPPPAKDSRTNNPSVKKDHESYCKYYHLVKKKMHLYTSKLGFIPALISAEKARPGSKQGKEKTKHLPEVFVKRLREGDQGQQGSRTRSPGKQKSLTKTDLGSTLFPPIKLGQIVNIY
ncbi:uncharacterized protein LOC128240971 [Mya arenaria]|uniref:uncharacterized protein LOC128240971 n=1 Tax=Mya arenaria TaxID=6604 RepID=UPI0022DFF843|nr:uncharacterized protein LOC128240971 [Mya arenaria]